MRRLGNIVHLLILVLLLLGSFLIIFERAMVRDYYPDENQFVASGKLLEAEGLLPSGENFRGPDFIGAKMMG